MESDEDWVLTTGNQSCNMMTMDDDDGDDDEA